VLHTKCSHNFEHSWYNLRPKTKFEIQAQTNHKITCAPKTSFKSKRKQIIKSLRIISRFSCYNDAICFGQYVDKFYSRVEDQVLCVLHLHKRIIEKVITLLVTRSDDELTSEEKTKRVKHIVVLQSYINTIALGSVMKPGHWKCPGSRVTGSALSKINKGWATVVSQMVRPGKSNNSCLPSSPRLWCWKVPRLTIG
jgi:hypothetical protein